MFKVNVFARTAKAHDRFNAVEAAAFTIVFMLAVYFTCGMWFETNDDVLMAEIMSGKVLGFPDYLSANIGFLLTWLISRLYGVTASVPWWGLFLFLCLSSVVFCISFFSLRYSKTIVQNLIAIAAVSGVLLLGFHNFGEIQYTGCAILLATTGYYILLCDDHNKRAIILFVLFELLSCILRDKSMLVVQPVCFSFVAVFHMVQAYDNEDKSQFKLAVKKMAVCFVLVLLCIGAVEGGQKLAFSSDEWRTYKLSDDVRVLLVDYDEEVSYETLKDVFSGYNISEEEYDRYLEYRIWYPDYKFSEQLFNDLLPILKEIRSQKPKYNIVTAIGVLLWNSTEFWHLHQFTLLLFAAAAVMVLFAQSKKHLLTIGAGFFGYLIGIVFFAFRNRYALRVMIPYYLSAILFLVGVMIIVGFDAKKRTDRKWIGYTVPGVILAGYVFAALSIGRVQFSYVRAQNAVVNAVEKNVMTELTDYCNANPDKTFIIDNSIFRTISTDVFETDYYRSANYIYSGSWYETAYTMVNRANQYLNSEDFYVPVYEAQQWKGKDGISFWENKSGCSASLYDKFKLSNGATVWVYRFKK